MESTADPVHSDADALRARSLGLLDFPTVREQVAEHATFGPARELALRLTPAYTSHEVEILQRETAEGIVFLEETGDISLHDAGAVSPAVERAALQGMLTGLELLAVAALLDVQRRARSALLRAQARLPILSGMLEGIPDLLDLERQVRSCIGGRGEVLDTATPSLGALRRQVREASERLTSALEHIIDSPVGREALQDRVISIRGDRLVLQVRTERRSQIPGIVQDASNTGATLFIEPFSAVDLGNAWRELALHEEREAAKVLRDLSAMVGAVAEDINRGVQVTARLDLILARARYSKRLGGVAALSTGPSAPGPPGEQTNIRLLRARHPMLGEEAVPITVRIGPGWSVLVITGPNAGGKTVAMKTVGLLALMHQSGLHIPAEEGSTLPVFDGIYADIGDQQSIQLSVSTFGSHMRNVIDILPHANDASLVLLDELGTSTDPDEGSALAKAILGRLASRGVATVATTHYRTVAVHAETTAGMMNASVDVNPDTLRPAYHLTLGVPGRSYAMSVAAQMGMPEEIMDGARSLLEPQHLRFEDWLGELQSERNQLKSSLQEAQDEQARAEAARRELDAQLDGLASRREEILHTMRRELVDRYEAARAKLRRAEAALSWSSPSVSAQEKEIKGARDDLESAKREMAALADEAPELPHRADIQPLAAGDAVEIEGLGMQGTVVSVPEYGGDVEVEVGHMRFRLGRHRLTRAQEEQRQEGSDTGLRYDLGALLPSPELDIRGARAGEALVRVDEFLDKALRDGLGSVRIIHGKGTGALRRVVRELLEGHPLAKSFAGEAPDEGGDGVTVVELM